MREKQGPLPFFVLLPSIRKIFLFILFLTFLKYFFLYCILLLGKNCYVSCCHFEKILISRYSLDTYTKHPTFSVGLQGLGEEDIEKVINVIHETFQNIFRYVCCMYIFSSFKCIVKLIIFWETTTLQLEQNAYFWIIVNS